MVNTMDNGRKRSALLQYALALALAAAIAVIMFYVVNRLGLNAEVIFDPDPTVTRNPMTGFAPDAANKKACRNSDLVFILVRWADWEKEKGVYDVEALEKKYNITTWKQQKKHAVLRFVCDIPGEENHLDIPQWLYEEIHDGVHYDTSLGRGYSPNYANAQFQDAHRRAIKKLAEYCDRDGFVTFVELGSLGHWGEWHASDGRRSIMPDADVCEAYISLYSDSFENALLLTRRPYQAALEEGMGVYNDMIGNLEDTEEWLGWLEKGGSQPTSGRPLTLSPIENRGMNAPVGGEFASDEPMEYYLGDRFGDVLASISASGITFIGPMTPNLTDEGTALARESILRRIGYRLYTSKMEINYDFSQNMLDIALTWENAGNAGFFFDWPVTVYVYDGQKQMVYWETIGLDLRDVNVGEIVVTNIRVPFADSIKDEFYFGVGITDYQGQERVYLSIDPDQMEERIDDIQILYHYEK